jgi:radical SAM protein with 4Fe4S-binding SPASM domain
MGESIVNTFKQTTYSEVRKKERQPLIDVVPLARPYILYIEPSSICNFKCVQCPQSLENHDELAGLARNMNMESFSKIIDDIDTWRKELSLGEEPFFRVVKTYLFGESLISPDYCEMVEILKAKNIASRVELTTNGSLLTGAVSERLVSSKLDFLRVSVYSVEEAKNRSLTQSSFTPKKIRENISRLKEIKNSRSSPLPYVFAQMIDTFSDENDLFRGMYRYIADEVNFETPMNWTGEDDFIGRMYEGASRKAWDALKSFKVRKACHSPFHSLAVRSDGDVISCCRDWQGKTKLGNIHDESLMEIWNGNVLKEFRYMHLDGKRDSHAVCADCTWPNTMPEEDSLDDITIGEFEKRLLENGE